MTDDINIPAAQLRNAAAWAAFNMPPRLHSLHSATEKGIITSKVMYRDLDVLHVDSDRGCVVLCFDVQDGGRGPEGFDAKLLNDLVGVAEAVFAVTIFDSSDPYTAAVDMAFKTAGVVLLAETTDACAGQWLALANRLREPGRWLLWDAAPAGRA